MKRILLLSAALLSTPLHAELADEEIDRLASEVQARVVEWRRWFHQYPELSNREFETGKRIAEILRGMGLEPQTGIARTGVVAVIEGGRPGPLIALRADMDGLPVTEQTGLPFASTARSEYNGQETGVMHACGHDTHMAMLLGAAEVLMAIRDDLPGSVMLIFQPAEEGAPPGEEGGAALMLKEGLWAERKPEAIVGIHVGIGQPSGEIGVRAGPLMAAADRYLVTIHGRQTHGARPWDGVDPIVAAAQVILGLQTIASRQVDVTQAPSIISVGRISGGIRNNVIPDEVTFEGTIRTFNQAMREQIHQRIEHTAKSIAESAGATATFELDEGTPAVINDAGLLSRMMPTLQRVVGEGKVNDIQPQTVAEDFSLFANETPAIFLFLSNLEPDADPANQPVNHSPFFTMYEPSMQVGVRIFSHLVVDYLRN